MNSCTRPRRSFGHVRAHVVPMGAGTPLPPRRAGRMSARRVVLLEERRSSEAEQSLCALEG